MGRLEPVMIGRARLCRRGSSRDRGSRRPAGPGCHQHVHLRPNAWLRSCHRRRLGRGRTDRYAECLEGEARVAEFREGCEPRDVFEPLSNHGLTTYEGEGRWTGRGRAHRPLRPEIPRLTAVAGRHLVIEIARPIADASYLVAVIAAP